MSHKSTGRGQTKTPPRRPPDDGVPKGLSAGEFTFALAWLANGGNAARAYLESHPRVTYGTAAVQGHRTLNRPNVRRYISSRQRQTWKQLRMSGDEALYRVALDARADLRGLFGDDGKMLDPHLWPDDLANSIEAVSIKEDGSISVKVASKATARRIILEQTGKLRSKLEDSMSAIAKALRRDLGKDEDEDADDD